MELDYYILPKYYFLDGWLPLPGIYRCIESYIIGLIAGCYHFICKATLPNRVRRLYLLDDRNLDALIFYEVLWRHALFLPDEVLSKVRRDRQLRLLTFFREWKSLNNSRFKDGQLALFNGVVFN